MGSQARILYAHDEGRIEIALAMNQAVRDGRLSGPVVISRDHHDVSGTDSPFRETSDVYDGSSFCAGNQYYIIDFTSEKIGGGNDTKSIIEIFYTCNNVLKNSEIPAIVRDTRSKRHPLGRHRWGEASQENLGYFISIQKFSTDNCT